jgi:hypothetical protein
MPKWKARNDICCGSINLSLGIWLIAAHSILQGLFGVFIVYTSKYTKEDFITNLICAVGCFALIFVGSKYF